MRTVDSGVATAASMINNAGAAGRLAALGARLDKAGLSKAADVLRPVRAVPTIFPWVDCTLGVGGWPTDRFSIVHGPSNNGKTVFVLGQCLSFVKVGHPALYLDAERTTANSGDWVHSLMGPLASSPLFRMKKPKSYEDIVEMTRVFCEAIGEAKAKGEVDEDTTALVVLDSLRKAVPQKFLDEMLKEFGSGKNDRHGIDPAGGRAEQIKAKLNGIWADELTALLDDTGTAMIVIGREYQNTDASQWAPEYKLGGGGHIVFEASLQVRITESGRVLDEEKRLLATEHAAEVRKTKIAGKEERYPRAFFHLATGVEPGVPYGFDRARDVLALARHLGIVTGSWNAFEGENLGQGEDKALRALRTHPEMLARVETACRLAKLPADAIVEVTPGEGVTVAQEGSKDEPAAPKATAAPRKRTAAGKATQKGKAGKGGGKGSKRS